MSFTGSGSPGSSPCIAYPHSCEMDYLEERHQGSKESFNEREKTALRYMRAEIELSQPQLLGISYLLVRITLTGQSSPSLPTQWSFSHHFSYVPQAANRADLHSIKCIRAKSFFVKCSLLTFVRKLSTIKSDGAMSPSANALS